MKKNIYIVGDSFCHWRSDENSHWPLILANMLGLNLKGNGYAGLSWWKTRKDFINFKETKDFENTEYFMFVHTDFSRILSDIDFFHELPEKEFEKEFEKIREIWIKYMYNEEIEFWMMCNWFREINDLLKEKKVIHISGFDNPIKNFHLLNGLKFKDSLKEHSLNELKNSSNEKLIKKGLIDDFRHNHFSIENNLKLALTIHNNIQKFYNTNFLNNEYTQIEL